MSAIKSPPLAGIIQRLRKLWCVRINGINTYNCLADQENGRVPSPEEIPKHWCGRWGTDSGYTFICLRTGDLFVLSGEPNSELLKLLEGDMGLCPCGSELRVPYLHEESLFLEELLARVRDPFHAFEPLNI